MPVNNFKPGFPAFFPIDNYEPVELQVYQTGTPISQANFVDQPELRYAPLMGLETYTDTVMPLAPKSGLALPSLAILKNSFLTLYTEQYKSEDSNNDAWGFKNGIFRIPLLAFYNFEDGTNPFIRYQRAMRGQTVQWEKCFISFATAQTFAAPTAFVLGVYYPSTNFQTQLGK